MEIIYENTLFCADLKKVAKAFLKKLPEQVTTLVSRGSSGCAIASAMLALSRKSLSHVFVRKEREISHGRRVVNANALSADSISCFVDDFIDCGKTVEASAEVLGFYKKNISFILVGKVCLEIGRIRAEKVGKVICVFQSEF